MRFLDPAHAEKRVGSEKAQVPDQLYIFVLDCIHERRAALYVSEINSCVRFQKNDSQLCVVVFCSQYQRRLEPFVILEYE